MEGRLGERDGGINSGRSRKEISSWGKKRK